MMEVVISLVGDGAWADLKDRKVVPGKITHAAALDHGMESGRPSMAFRVELPSGEVAFCELSMRMLQAIARAFTAKYGQVD